MSARQSATSRDLCTRALEAYQTLFSRLAYQDPDAGFGESYSSGMRWLEALRRAEAWAVPPATVEAVERLLEVARSLDDEDVADWVDLYPHRFLMLIDRRHGALMRRQEGRRALDRIATGGLILAAH